MSRTVLQMKDDLIGMLHGTTLDKIKNLNSVFNRAARDFLLDVDPEETRRTQTIVNALYDKVYDYQVPSDLKSDHIINIYPLADNPDEPSFEFTQEHERHFDIDRTDKTFDVLVNNGTRYVRIAKTLNENVTINTVDSLTDNGAWSAYLDGQNVELDELNYVSGLASIRFGLSDSTGDGGLDNTTMTAVDLSDFEDLGSIFVNAYFNGLSRVNSVTLTWGNDLTANYWTKTVTAQHFGSFVSGWNLLRFDWDTATQVGTPNSSTVDSVRVSINYDQGSGALTNFRLDNIVCANGVYYGMSYYSKYLFQGSSGTWKEDTDDDDDIINLDTHNFNLYLFKVASLAAAQTADNKDDALYFNNEYTKALREYKKQNGSDRQKKSQSYYNF